MMLLIAFIGKLVMDKNWWDFSLNSTLVMELKTSENYLIYSDKIYLSQI